MWIDTTIMAAFVLSGAGQQPPATEAAEHRYSGIDWYSGTVALLALGLALWVFIRQRKAEQAPQLELEKQVVSKGTALRVTSLGPVDYHAVRMRIVPPPTGSAGQSRRSGTKTSGPRRSTSAP